MFTLFIPIIIFDLKLDNTKKTKNSGKECLVAVPYEMEQGEWEGNVHETHLQEDLTEEIMKGRYPKLDLLYGNNIVMLNCVVCYVLILKLYINCVVPYMLFL